jgi:hypothetical protein
LEALGYAFGHVCINLEDEISRYPLKVLLEKAKTFNQENSSFCNFYEWFETIAHQK